jgi:hypothetical protein
VACTTGPRVQWTPESGGNGHFYQAVCATSTWDQANAAATASGGHLATLTSAEENAFAFALVDDPSFWTLNEFDCNNGPWLGAMQPSGSAEPTQAWEWVTGEPFSFAAWHVGEPNNYMNWEEDSAYFYDCMDLGTRSAQWNDGVASLSVPGYVVEWEHSLDVDLDGQVEPLTDGLLILRRLFGFTGASLTNGAVDLANCNRCDATVIQPFLAQLSAGVVHDLVADWSESSNPNGAWSYLQGTTPLGHLASWGTFPATQPAWATAASGPGHVPAFYKAVTAEHDYLVGDVVIHSRDDGGGGGQGDARLRFTAPSSGVYRVDLDAWIVRDIGRTVPWTLAVEGSAIDTGTVASGDQFSRAHPDGTSQSVELAAGDTVDFVLNTPGGGVPGDLVGTRLRLEALGIDVDGDGSVEPLTDGLLVLRYLFGFTGTSLTLGAVDLTNCTRCDAVSIDAYLDGIADL